MRTGPSAGWKRRSTLRLDAILDGVVEEVEVGVKYLPPGEDRQRVRETCQRTPLVLFHRWNGPPGGSGILKRIFRQLPNISAIGVHYKNLPVWLGVTLVQQHFIEKAGSTAGKGDPLAIR